MAWIPSSQMINGFLNSWSSRKVLAEIRKNVDVITVESFRAGLISILLAACRENDVAVLRELLPLSLRHYDIDFCYAYKIRTEKKDEELFYGFYSFFPHLTWITYSPIGGYDEEELANFKPSVQLRGTLLHIAAQQGRLKAAQLLLSEGAKVDAVNCCGRTPLMMGIHHLDVAKYFINSARCNVNHQDMWGQTALMLVVWKAKTCKSLLKPLLDAGANPRIVDQYGKTMVHYACELIIDGDTIPYLIKNNLLDIECGDNGRVLYERIPLVINHGFSHFTKSKDAYFPPLFFAHLAYCELLNARNYDEFQQKFPVIIKRVQELGVSYEYAQAEVYGNRREITTIDEFNTSILTASDKDTEILYQYLIIAERLVGSSSPEYISLLWNIIHADEGNPKIAEQICHWLEILSCFLQNHKLNSSIVEHFSYFGKKRLSFVGLTRQHKLWFEFLTKYTKTVQSLVANDVHVHRYGHRPRCDIAAVPFGTSYMEQKIPQFLPNAVYMIAYFIYEAVTTNDDAYDEALFRKLVSSCDVYQYSSMFEQGQVLVQSSSILYTYLVNCPEIEDDDISVCAKICEMSTADLVNSPVPDRRTLLHYAVKIGNIQLVDFLLDQGAHPDAVDAKGLTPVKNANDDSVSPAILTKLLPQRLFCIAAKAIVDGGLPYQKLGLPDAVVEKVNYHDKRRFL